MPGPCMFLPSNGHRVWTVAGVICAALAPISSGAEITIGPPVRIDEGVGIRASNETTAVFAGASEIVAGWNDWRETVDLDDEIIRTGFGISLDGGRTWTDFLVRPPEPHQSDVEGDPMTAVDPRTGTIWAGGISFSGFSDGVFVARKSFGDQSFEPAVMARIGPSDKGWMAAGPLPGLPDTTRVYIGFDDGLIWSDDLGESWTDPVPLETGIGYLPRIGPDGELYIAFWDYAERVMLARSLDGGESISYHLIAERMDFWGTQDGSRFPGTFRVPCLSYLAVDPVTGRLYAIYFDTTDRAGGNANVDLYLTISEDRGDTWSVPTIVNTDAAPPGDQFFCWLEVDESGRLHLEFMDSRNTVQDDDVEDGMFDVYYALSETGGETWSEHRLTDRPWSSDDDGLDRPQQFLGDYLALCVSGDLVAPIYIDTSAGDPDVFTRVIELSVSGDLDDDGTIGFGDLLILLNAWGPCFVERGCSADLDQDGSVGFIDLLMLLAEWR